MATSLALFDSATLDNTAPIEPVTPQDNSSRQSAASHWQNVLHARPFPAVVSGLQVRELRNRLSQSADLEPSAAAAIRDFLGAYLGFDARSAFALSQTLGSLSQTTSGGAFWLNGVYGSGKSHLLGLLALLCDGAATQSALSEEFAAHFPSLAPLAAAFRPRLVVHVSLDEYSAAQFGLEEIFWRELSAEWQRQGLESFEVPCEVSRAESFAALESALLSQERQGLVVLFDEVSLFLGGRERKALQNDAAFLQFLGQYARRVAAHPEATCPLWVVGALQKTIDDIADLEPYALGQIRDRFTLLPLSLAHLPSLVEQRLVQVRDEVGLALWCEASFEAVERALPHLDFGSQEWRALAPFHPATIATLEQVTGRFFSRTRSAALFCTQSLSQSLPLENRVGPESIWDYFFPDLTGHPDLRPLLEVWDNWNDVAGDVGGTDEAQLRRAMKFLLVCKIGGVVVTPVALANALLLDVGLGGESSYEWARQLLEKLRRNAPFLAVERAEESLFDRYTIDFGRKVSDLARRQVMHISHELVAGDPRLGAAALRACRDEPLPLAEMGAGRSVFLHWANSPRQISIGVWDGAAPSTLANRIAATRELGYCDDAFLLFLLPFARDEFDINAVTRLLGDERARAAFWVWSPRPPARDEWDLCREVAAIQLAMSDPALLDNRRGRAILEHLEKEAAGRARALSRVVNRLFLEGEIVLGTGAVLEASELGRGESLVSLLERVADFALPQLYPHFIEIAPRARLLTPSNADTLVLELLRRPLEEPYFAPSLERLARHLAEPLGLAKSSSGRWKIAAGEKPLTETVKDALGEGTTYAQLEATLAKSEWGLGAEMWSLTLAGMIRAGEVSAFDARGQELSPHQIGVPLRRGIHTLRVGKLPDSTTWTRLALLARELWGGTIGAVSFDEVARLTAQLELWREETTRFLELSQARAMQLRRQLKHEATAWPRFDAICETLASGLVALRQAPSGGNRLSCAASLDPHVLHEAQNQFLRVAEALEKRLPLLLASHALLLSPELVVPPDLAESRLALLEALAGGESVLDSDQLEENLERWRDSYATSYAQWHQSQHDPARALSLRRVLQGETLRAVERLGTLHHRDWHHGAEIRQELEAELDKMCPRDGSLEHGAAVCASCGLKIGERVRLINHRDLETRMEEVLNPLREVLRTEPLRLVLARSESPLIEWDEQGSSLLPLLSSAALNELDSALAPRRRVVRQLDELTASLQSCRTRSECETAFANWLDGGENLSGNDEVLWGRSGEISEREA